MPQSEPDQREMGLYMALSQIGLEMVGPMGIGIALDYYLHWTPPPWATVIGFAVGFLGGFAHLLMLVSQQDKGGRSKPGGGRP
jgi:hypothetical protein